MGYTVFITEKPSVAQEYRKVLGVSSNGKTNGYIEGHSSKLGKDVIITWAVGHLISLCSPNEHDEKWGAKNWKDLIPYMPMIPSEYKYKPNGATYDQFKVVKSIYTRKDIDAIYYAGDSGREGIYIQALIRNQIFKSKPNLTEKVVWIDSYTEESILNGIKTAKDYSHYQPMIDSGYARAIADWLMGMNLTTAFSVTSGSLITVGRVMTPTLAMALKRQNEIENFKETIYFGLNANISDEEIAKWKSNNADDNRLYNESGFLKKEDVESLLDELNKDKYLTVEKIDRKEKTEYAPLLFNLADLQNHCSKVYHISPSQTLEIAQSLYEKKLTTYPRTDARVLSSAVASDIQNKLGKTVPKKYVDDSKITDHYAIIPTFEKAGGLSDLEEKVYQDIVTRFYAIFEKPYIYDTVTVCYVHSNKEHFYSSVKIVKQLGYKELYGEKVNNTTINCSVNDKVAVREFAINEMKTTPPSAYTTGSMIMAMEKSGKLIEDEELREQIKTCGIGTSATRAGIIEKLADKKYIDIDKKQKITVTDLGKKIIPIIEKYDTQIVSPEKTADLEQRLCDIVDGKASFEEFKKYINTYVTATTDNILKNNKESVSSGNAKGNTYACPCCDKDLSFGQYGYYCNKNNGGCGFSIGNFICGAKITETDVKDLITKGSTKAKKMKSKAGKEFFAKIIVNKNEHKTEFDFSK